MTETPMTPAPPIPIRRDAAAPFDPTPELTQLRATQPISRMELPNGSPAYLLTRYEDVRRVLGDRSGFSITDAPPDIMRETEAAPSAPIPGNLLGLDPPEHTRLRRLLIPEFTMKRMSLLGPRIEQIVQARLAAMESAGPPADLVQDIAHPVPSLVICELLGVPYEDRDEFQGSANVLTDLSRSPEEVQDATAGLAAYMDRLVAAQRARPDGELLGRLVRRHGDDVSDEELAGIGMLLLIAGHETTANMLALGTLALLRHPDQLAAARDVADPVAANGVVEELLRYLSIAPAPARRAISDTRINGLLIRAGDLVVCSLPAANRDPARHNDPDRLDVGRKAAAHLAFGHGIHQCLGQQLARLEMRVAYPALLRRFPDLKLAVPFEKIRFRALSVVYGVRALPVTW